MFTLTLLLVIGTFLAVFVSLFGEQLKRVWFGPRLEVELSDTTGEKTYYSGTGQTTFFYHLSIKKRRGDIAHNVFGYLSMCEIKSAKQEHCYIWKGEIPLKWKYSFLYGFTARNICSSQACDILSITEDGIKIETVAMPNSLETILAHLERNNCDTVLTFYAKGDETVSPEKKFHIKWDGVWIPEPEEMKSHLTVEEMNENEYREWSTFAKNEELEV